MPEKFEPDDATIEGARKLYDEGQSWKKVAAAFGVSVTTAKKYIALWEWPAREVEVPPQFQKKSADPRDEPQEPTRDTTELARRVETAVRKELTAIEKRVGSSTAASAERNARVLASLVKSLAELRKLDREEAQEQHRNEGDHDDEPRPPRDLARLRDELAADLERIRAQEDAARQAQQT
jgi:hypothetical protein